MIFLLLHIFQIRNSISIKKIIKNYRNLSNQFCLFFKLAHQSIMGFKNGNIVWETYLELL